MKKGPKKRDEVEILAAAGTTVTLGGRDYSITPKPRGKSRMVRRKLGELLETFSGASGLLSALTSKDVVTPDADQLSTIIPLLNSLLGPNMDDLLDIVYEYEPAIAADRKYLEGDDPDHPDKGGTDEEFINALIVIVGMFFGPLSRMAGQMNLTMMTGQSPANNGSNGDLSTPTEP